MLAVLMVIAISAFGIYQYSQLPVDAFPDVSPTMVPIFTEAEGWPEIWDHASVAPFIVISKLENYFKAAKRKGLTADIDPHFTAVSFFSFFFRSMISVAFLGRDPFLGTDDDAIDEYARMFVRGIGNRE